MQRESEVCQALLAHAMFRGFTAALVWAHTCELWTVHADRSHYTTEGRLKYLSSDSRLVCYEMLYVQVFALLKT